MILDGDCRTDRRYLEIRASSYAERAQLNWGSEVIVILSRPAPQPAAGDSAVAQPTTTPFTGLVRAPEPIGDTPPRHIPLSTSLRALPCVPSGVVVCAGHPEPCPAATGGSGFTIEIGSDFVIGPARRRM